MAERRAIYSGIWDDDLFGNNSFIAELVWIGLFSKCADDQGRLEDNPALIRKNVFPYKDIALSEIEECLVSYNGHLIRYEVDGKKYIQIATWWDHQPLQYAVPSKYPAPEGWTDRYRTYYKGTKIVFNWPSAENTEEGEALYSKLGSLGRVSTWTDYVGSLNTNPNTNPNPNHINSEIAKKAAKTPKAKAPEEEKPNLYQIARALSDVSGLDFEKNRPMLFRFAKKFKQGEEQQIIREYGIGGLWFKADWRGKKNQKATPSQVVETWNNLSIPVSSGDTTQDIIARTMAKAVAQKQAAMQ